MSKVAKIVCSMNETTCTMAHSVVKCDYSHWMSLLQGKYEAQVVCTREDLQEYLRPIVEEYYANKHESIKAELVGMSDRLFPNAFADFFAQAELDVDWDLIADMLVEKFLFILEVED